MSRLAKDCFNLNGTTAPLISMDDALARLNEVIVPVTGTERVDLKNVVGRILAEDQVSTVTVPPFNNSSVDGWAAFFRDIDPARETKLPVGGRIAAGHPLPGQAFPGHAYRIFTGAPLPLGMDVVAMQEECRETEDGAVILPDGLTPGLNVRLAGESVALGDIPLKAGIRLAPQHVGVAATMGLIDLPVRRRLKVAVFSTGDEVCAPGKTLSPGCLYDANRFTLTALLNGVGCDISDLGILPDRFETIRDMLSEAATNHDLIVTSGGVSVGGEDHVKKAVTTLGKLHLWRLALKPGKPLALGQIGDTVFLGLPGNPVAVMVTFFLIARPLIAAMCGAIYQTPRRFHLPAAFTLKRGPERREFPRAFIVDSASGPAVRLFHSDSSGILTSLSTTDGLVDLPETALEINPGDLVSFLPFSEVLT